MSEADPYAGLRLLVGDGPIQPTAPHSAALRALLAERDALVLVRDAVAHVVALRAQYRATPEDDASATRSAIDAYITAMHTLEDLLTGGTHG